MPREKENNPSQDRPLIEPTIAHTSSIIKIIGVGGGGGNAVAQMYREGIHGVRFLVCNTDRKALETSIVPDQLTLGPGLGAGGRPEKGRELAEESIEKIRGIFEPDVKMIFLTAGMGGGTGTGASPVIAREARSRGILTVGIVTLPFLFERFTCIDKALDGLETLSKEVDAMLVVNNERLRELYPNLNIISAFAKADETLTKAVRSIVEIIEMRGRVILDFRDIDNALRDGGVAIISYGYGTGENRLADAISHAIYSPLLNNNDIYRSRKLIMKITTSKDPDKIISMEEMGEINNFTAKFPADVWLKWGLDADPSIGDGVRVTILASGFHLYDKEAEPCGADSENDEVDAERILRYYPDATNSKGARPSRRRPRAYIFETDDLDNEALVGAVDASVTYRRTKAQLKEIAAIAAQAVAPAAPEEEETSPEAGTMPVIEF